MYWNILSALLSPSIIQHHRTYSQFLYISSFFHYCYKIPYKNNMDLQCLCVLCMWVDFFFLTHRLVTYNRSPNWLIGLLDTILWSLNGVCGHPQGRLVQCDIREVKWYKEDRWKTEYLEAWLNVLSEMRVVWYSYYFRIETLLLVWRSEIHKTPLYCTQAMNTLGKFTLAGALGDEHTYHSQESESDECLC